jgi:membrane protease YdiL (CAAX protease family)
MSLRHVTRSGTHICADVGNNSLCRSLCLRVSVVRCFRVFDGGPVPKLDPKRFPLAGVDVLVCSAVAAGVYLLLKEYLPLGPSDPPGSVFVRTGALALGFAVPPLVLLRLRRRSALRVWMPPRDLGRDIAAGLVLALLLAVMNGLALKIGIGKEGFSPGVSLDGVVWGARGFRDVGILLLALGIITPVAEEMFFRGVLYPALRKRLPAAPAIVLSSAVFGAAHLDSMRTHAFLLGLVAAILVEYTGSLVPAVLAHAGMNTAFVLFLANGGILAKRAPLWVMAVFFVVLNALLFALGKTLFAPDERPGMSGPADDRTERPSAEEREGTVEGAGTDATADEAAPVEPGSVVSSSNGGAAASGQDGTGATAEDRDQ